MSIIFQEMELLPNLTVAENIFLGRQPRAGREASTGPPMNRQARKLLDSVNTSISERELVSSLSVGQMQMVEIAKALSFSARRDHHGRNRRRRYTGKEVDALFDNIRDLRAKGVAICYISHRLEEIKRIADRVTVFRDGANVGTRPTGELSIDEMVTMMVGREMDDYYPKVETTAGGCAPGAAGHQARRCAQGRLLRRARRGDHRALRADGGGPHRADAGGLRGRPLRLRGNPGGG